MKWNDEGSENVIVCGLTHHPSYNKRQMSRIYPKGGRVDSSNYMPQVARSDFVLRWNTVNLQSKNVSAVCYIGYTCAEERM